MNLMPNELKEAPSLFQHLLNIRIFEKPQLPRATKIFCKIGSKCCYSGTLLEMIKSGMDVACIDFSEGQRREHEHLMQCLSGAIERQSQDLGYKCNVATAAMLAGANVRISVEAPNGLKVLARGSYVKVATSQLPNEKEYIRVYYNDLFKNLSAGQNIYIDGESVKLKILNIFDDHADCEVITGGVVRTKQSLLAPQARLETLGFTEKDYCDLKFVLHNNFDFIVVPQVTNAEILRQIRSMASKYSSKAKIIVKIENMEALLNLREIVKDADGLFLARTNLVCQCETNFDPMLQKLICKFCNRNFVPVICDVSFALSTTGKMKRSFGHVMDVGNAITDGASAICLTDSTSLDEDPVGEVQLAQELCSEAERATWNVMFSKDMEEQTTEEFDIAHSFALLAVEKARSPIVSAIVILTVSGSSAQQLSMHRPRCPIISTTHSSRVARSLNLYRNVISVLETNVKEEKNFMQRIEAQTDLAMAVGYKQGFLENGDEVVVLTPYKADAGYRNTMHVVNAFFDVEPMFCNNAVVALIDEVLSRRRIIVEQQRLEERERRRRRRKRRKAREKAEKEEKEAKEMERAEKMKRYSKPAE